MILGSGIVPFDNLPFTRTCGGDPSHFCLISEQRILLPALAGVILDVGIVDYNGQAFTRTCGGDPT